ncbi:MAG TPA: transposase, partial [Steroidobacteraceae bacterium]|nr:transposase [Steroidobacteraceae bacterium]
LEALPRSSWPTFGRGDCGYGSEKLMEEFESRQLPYLFKLRHTLKVKVLVQQMMRGGAGWQDCGDGWEAMEAAIRLGGWTRERRVVLVREAPALAPVAEKRRRRHDHQSLLPNAAGAGWDAQAVPWSGKIAVLVTSLDVQAWPTVWMPRLYRERGDAENSYDELKNQWGWNGYTTRKLAPCRLMANLIALFYNWWNLYLRLR